MFNTVINMDFIHLAVREALSVVCTLVVHTYSFETLKFKIGI